VLFFFICQYSFGQSNFSALVELKASPELQGSNATQPALNPAVGLGSLVAGNLVSVMSNPIHQKGFTFKNPNISGGFTYRSSDDSSLGGFVSNEYDGDLSFDADIRDGLIAGVLYQHCFRTGDNIFGTSEKLESNGVSIYTAKRFFDIANAGVAYNQVWTDHNLRRAVTLDLGREAKGFTVFLGTSDKVGRTSWAVTPSFTWLRDDYVALPDLDTGLLVLSANVNYEITDVFTLGAAFSYNYFVIQDTFPNTVIRDDDYFTIGPRFRFYPTDQLTINWDLDTQQGFNDFVTYSTRIGVDVAY